MSLTLQLINGISRASQKWCKYFNDKMISTSFVLSSAGIFPAFLAEI